MHSPMRLLATLTTPRGYIIETLREHLPSQRSTVSEIHREEITPWSVGRAPMVSGSDARRLSSNFCLDS